MPNLVSAVPVVILAWVLASTSGLMRRVIGARLPSAARNLIERRKLRFAFDIELIDARLQGRAHLLARLADAGKHNFARGNARRQRLGQFAARHHIGARAQLRQRLQHRQIAIGLDG